MYPTQQNPNLTVYIILEMRVPLSSFIITQQQPNHNVLYINPSNFGPLEWTDNHQSK